MVNAIGHVSPLHLHKKREININPEFIIRWRLYSFQCVAFEPVGSGSDLDRRQIEQRIFIPKIYHTIRLGTHVKSLAPDIVIAMVVNSPQPTLEEVADQQTCKQCSRSKHLDQQILQIQELLEDVPQ
ncbi:hypothetical protein EVAR_19112_1 [Eumeta japonica]|uniref:Uncharacterized protein n=1 Tax=Eumeta variegata TaxID=151549 RepID=A0A4C1UP66_EUMVA|nr:hypothetical protein EVAR_19112_1 [Eumeta japonica]